MSLQIESSNRKISKLKQIYFNGEWLAPMQWPSPAKLNLFLYILGRRSDGYHELQTFFKLLDYGDILEIKPLPSSEIQIEIQSANIQSLHQNSSLDIPNSDNLIYKAADELQKKTDSHQGAHIKLIKNLPIGGGVGGGSSNAATTLVALNELWQTHLTSNELCAIGLKLGADVPVFIQGNSAFAEGVGEVLTQKNDSSDNLEQWFLVVKPDCMVNTKIIFSHPDLTRNTPKRTMQECFEDPFRNDCQEIACKNYPDIEKAIQWLLQYAPNSQPRLTGTGACVFAQFSSRESAMTVFSLLPPWLTGFVSQGINVSPLLTKLYG